MIGTSAVLTDLIGVLLFVGVGLGAALASWKQSPLKDTLVRIVMILLGLTVLTKTWFTVEGYRVLRRLSAANVISVQAGDITINDPLRISLLTSCMNKARWFTYSHGGQALPVPLVIKERSGATHVWNVSYYLREEGAIVDFGEAGEDFRLDKGESFIACLPMVLRDANVTLPTMAASKYEGARQ